jgi:hypothetical protein
MKQITLPTLLVLVVLFTPLNDRSYAMRCNDARQAWGRDGISRPPCEEDFRLTTPDCAGKRQIS